MYSHGAGCLNRESSYEHRLYPLISSVVYGNHHCDQRPNQRQVRQGMSGRVNGQVA